MKVFVTGVGGQLGHDLINELTKRNIECVGSDLAESYSGIMDGSTAVSAPYVSLDITDRDAVMKAINDIKPDAVMHCAAWTAVDAAEDDDKKDIVFKVNANGTANMADACKSVGASML